ncbi:Homocysteine S-methyltransferase 1 [Dissophora globulifera]|uniref:Homocysteine S-methyltransferase 1 n=1 Tax=Dissophora globulifera TaxID=979702 RepID=A0A9P6RLW2_9FUNG|nr:Homocysteine S-methyltransferase 1 [Dissophora globulifera]
MDSATAARKPHDRHEAELLIPLGLLAYTILAAVYRYFFVLRVRSYYRPLLSEITHEDGPEQSRATRATKLGLAIVWLNHIVGFSFVASLGVICLRAIVDHVWSGTLLVLYNVMSFVSITANLVLMHIEIDKGGQWSWANYGFWWLALAGESFIGWNHLESIPDGSTSGSAKWDLALVGIFAVRYALLWVLALLSVVHHRRESKEDDLDALRAFDAGAPETAAASSSSRAGAYGTFASAFAKDDNDTKQGVSAMGSSSDAEIQKKLKAEQEERATAFKDFWPKIKRLIPFVYPKNDAWLQFMIFLTFVFIALGRVVNLLVPMQTDRIIRRLASDDPFDIWGILLYVLYRYLQGGSGLISALRGWAWIPIEQYSNSTLTIRFFEHVHNLSLQFHLNRKTGELLRILDRGTSSIVSLLSTVLFQLVPVLADVTIAVVYFCLAWSWTYAVIVFITILSYIIVTVVITEWRTQFRRAMIRFDNDARTKAVDSLLNFETVKYYTAEEFEINRYREAIRKYMVADYKSQITYQLLNLIQSFVITMGMLAGCLLCAYEISEGKRDVSNFVTFIVYLSQLYAPLNWFGSYYRMLQQNFVDMEKMIALLDQNQSVKDVPGAGPLIVQDGEVVFENVSFQYDTRQKGLQNVSFTVPKGKTVALVGPTGSGKSTILRLLFRFYDVSSGRILIDGQDITQKTQLSLREQIGVVPQDSVLFNDSIYYNINYGRTDATREDVEFAAKAAQIHDKIMDFPDMYDTKVGERGLRLSGGEKQRVAIARTILKNPPIVLLDEATSALDSTTESQIQAALARMTENRTTLVVAHRLSTIVNSDLILCIKDGAIVEQGTHDELVNRALANGGEGVYYEMWRQQIREEHGDDSTVDGSASDDSESKKKGKGLKEPRGAHQSKSQAPRHEHGVAVQHPTTATPTAASVEETLPLQSPTDPTELTEVIVEPSAPGTSSASGGASGMLLPPPSSSSSSSSFATGVTAVVEDDIRKSEDAEPVSKDEVHGQSSTATETPPTSGQSKKKKKKSNKKK